MSWSIIYLAWQQEPDHRRPGPPRDDPYSQREGFPPTEVKKEPEPWAPKSGYGSDQYGGRYGGEARGPGPREDQWNKPAGGDDYYGGAGGRGAGRGGEPGGWQEQRRPGGPAADQRWAEGPGGEQRRPGGPGGAPDRWAAAEPEAARTGYGGGPPPVGTSTKGAELPEQKKQEVTVCASRLCFVLLAFVAFLLHN